MNILLRRAVWLVPVLALLLLSGAPARSEPTSGDDLHARMDDFARTRMSQVELPGLAYAVVEKSGTVHTSTFGHDGDGGDITAATPFLWGSVAKPVTATLVTAMAAAGELRLDAPVTAYLPSFRLRDATRSARITLRHLLEQTSGLATTTRYTDRTDPDRRPGDVLPELATAELVSEPGTTHHYSSTNYLLVSAVVEAVTGRPFARVLAERVLDPLGMRTAVTSAVDAERVPRGHRFVFGRAVPFATGYDPAGVGYGYLGGAVGAAAAFARAALGGGGISADQRTAMFDPAVRTGPDSYYGLGWRRWTLDGADTPMIWHGGSSPGFFAQVILLPERERAVVLLTNVSSPVHETQLLDTGFGLAQLVSGAAATPRAPDRAYAFMLGVLVALLAVLITASGLTARALTRPVRRDGRWRLALATAVWLTVVPALLYGLALALPERMGVRLGQLALWVPDIAWLVYGVLGTATLLLVLRLAVVARAVGGWRQNRTAIGTDE
ncbi:serine hydrolase domain-containing protein [Nocardia otitidiscaviarum]|uniref:serine hydrolase domain-containing protein n=1 Tax=Nocardia otitidiscaviarum TaxID=1823 RepID=UPI001893060F|nr:serine hydrolase domain-containing protein [Nocardia otitidiscaviarum]MBF6180118.1 beta-lactamase family protein [Nocardia otitidiscaviarum]